MKKQHLLFTSEETEMDLDAQVGLDDDGDDLYLHPYPDTDGFALFF